MKRNLTKRAYIFDFRGIGTEKTCDTIGCEGAGDIQVSLTDKEPGAVYDLYTFLCESCAMSNPITGMMLSILENDNAGKTDPNQPSLKNAFNSPNKE